MNIADAVKKDINEFGKLLNTGIFSKEIIENFLKINPDCSDDYINIISEYICEKYKNETNIYIEMARCNLNRDVKKSIKYLETYKINGGDNQDVLMLLLKLYREKGSVNKAIKLADNINFNNNIEIIEIIFNIYLSGKICEKNKQKFKNIFMEIDKYNSNDKKQLLNKMVMELLNKVRNENCEHLILTITENLKNLNSINKKYIADIRKNFLECHLDSYMGTANNIYMNAIINVIKSSDDDFHVLFNEKFADKVKELNIYNETKKKKILKIFKNNQDILTEGNKWQIIESVMSCYKNDFLKTIEMLCGFIAAGKYFDGKLSERLGLVLREKNFSVNEKTGMIRILKKYYKKTKNVKYKNIFLNEIEILQNKVILKSKPRAIMVLLRTNEIIEADSELYNFVVSNMPYFEEITWQTEDGSLNNKFKELTDLAYKYNVRQNIITLVDEDLISDESKEIADDGKGKFDRTEDAAEQKIVCSKGTKQYKYDLFYTSPWTRICLDFKRSIRINSSSNQIDIKKYKYDEIWNCKELVDYRKEIINNDFFRQFKTIDADKYETEDGKIKKLLKIFNANQDMLTDSNKWQIIEFLLSFYKKNIVKKIKMLCDFINNINSFNWKLSKELAILLREKNFSVDEKSSIIRILKKYYKKTKSVKYKNIFLNEIEILQNKVILKSKPRELDVTVTTRCNLRCIMCDIHDLPDYTVDNKIHGYIKKTLPYLENIVWKGGEVFLYDKFYEFVNIASRYGVLQTIITNGLFLTDNWVELIVQYKIELVISIDSADKKIYEGIRKGADFNVLINNLKILEKYYSQNDSFRYKMAVVVMSVNYNQIEQLINFAILHKFGSIHFQACTNCKNKYLLLNDSNRKEVIEQIEKYKNQYRNKITIFTDATLDINYFNQIPKTAESQICGCKKNTHKKKIQSLKKFCYRPFFKIALNSEQNNINFGCGCTSIDISKYQYDEIWNCSELVKYRKSIVSNDLSICKL